MGSQSFKPGKPKRSSHFFGGLQLENAKGTFYIGQTTALFAGSLNSNKGGAGRSRSLSELVKSIFGVTKHVWRLMLSSTLSAANRTLPSRFSANG
jgi:hypothetical protein